VLVVEEAGDAKLVGGSVRYFGTKSAQRGNKVLVKLDKDSEILLVYLLQCYVEQLIEEVLEWELATVRPLQQFGRFHGEKSSSRRLIGFKLV
jgi:hypothetical protein